MNEVAKELGCDWHTVNDAVVAYGEALLEKDTDRIGEVSALGLEEVLMVREGPYHRQHFTTQRARRSARWRVPCRCRDALSLEWRLFRDEWGGGTELG